MIIVIFQISRAIIILFPFHQFLLIYFVFQTKRKDIYLNPHINANTKRIEKSAGRNVSN